MDIPSMEIRTSPNEVYEAWKKDPAHIAILDVRTDSERSESQIPGSLHIPLDEISQRMEEIAPFKCVYAVCRSGGRSAIACARAQTLGYTHLVNISGGMKAWALAGLPLSDIHPTE